MAVNFTLFMIGLYVGALYWGWSWPYIAKLMPVYVAAIPGLILALFQLYRDATGWEARTAGVDSLDMDEVYVVRLDERTEHRRTVIFFAWFIGGAAGIWLLGIVISLPLLVFLYSLIDGRENLLTALIMAACTYALVWGFFAYLLEMRWPPGLLLGY